VIPPVLLHVEDNLDDRILFGQACVQGGVSFRLCSVEHGQAAIDYLRASGPYADRIRFPLPDAVLLDLKMPVLDGFSVLRWIRAQADFHSLPVLVFTSSYQHSDIERAYASGATAFFTKPSNFENLVQLAVALQTDRIHSGYCLNTSAVLLSRLGAQVPGNRAFTLYTRGRNSLRKWGTPGC
jgi:two-component system, response regulator